MSKIRYEQTQDTSHRGHVHDGVSGVRLQYDVDLHSQPRTLDNAREAKVRIMGTQGTIDYLEHGCGLTPIVKCYVGGKEVKIRVNIDRTTGFVTWSSEQEFTRADEAYLVIYGLATEYVIDDDAPEIDLTEYWCGYEWNVNDSDPSVKRITGKGLEDFFLREGGGILKGKLFKYVAVNPTTKEEVEVPIDDAEAYENYRYGQYGDLFAKMRGQLYYKVEKEGDIRRKKLSRYQLPGFKPYHSNDYIVYIGLYEASCDNERTKIYSRVTPESEYATHVGGNKNTNYTTKLYNMPATAINTPTFSNIAHSKGEGYDIMDYMTWLMLSDLFMAEFGTRDSQATIQSADSNGYSRGGLGIGCSNVSNWQAYNNYNPLAELGCTDSLGSGYGQRLIPACSNGVEPANAVYANRFYGIENPFGHIFKLLTGLHVITKAGEGQTYESRNMYICDNPYAFFDVANRDNATDDVEVQFHAGYDFEGNAPIGNGYVKDVVMGTYGSMLASEPENGASSSTYFCDYNYTNYTEEQFTSSLRWSAFGGKSNSGSVAGFFYLGSSYGWSSADWYYGSRLCLYKQPYEESYFFCEDCSGEDNTIIIKKNASEAPNVHVEYSYDTINWKELKTPTTEGSEIYLPANKKVYLRGENRSWSRLQDGLKCNNIDCIGNFNIGGNIMSLLWGKEFVIHKDLKYIKTFTGLFRDSINIINAKDLILSAEFEDDYDQTCYYKMFYNCVNLKTPPKILPSKLGVSECYAYMFYRCGNLEYAPEINIVTFVESAASYKHVLFQMFNGCSKINEIKCHFQHYDNSSNQFTSWLYNVSPTGTFWLPYDSVFADDAPRNADGIPAGWTIKYFDPETGLERERVTEEELHNTYFYVEDISGEANTMTIKKISSSSSGLYANEADNINLEYSYDTVTWKVIPKTTETKIVNIPSNGRVYLRGINYRWGHSLIVSGTQYIVHNNLTCSKSFSVGGNLMSLINSGYYNTKFTLEAPHSEAFIRLFSGNTNLKYSHNLVIQDMEFDSNTLNSLFFGMFQNSTGLITAPIMKLTYIGRYFCTFMLKDCTTLLKPMDLSTVSIVDLQGLYYAYNGCTSLKSTGNLSNIQSIGNHGCNSMFMNCTHLTEASDLTNLTTIGEYGCYQMFMNCSSLVQSPNMNNIMTIGNYGLTKMFTSCTSLTHAPSVLTAKESVGTGCCDEMFSHCINLEVSPRIEFIDIILNNHNLEDLFYQCNKLREITFLYPNSIHNSNWVIGVASNGVIYLNKDITYNPEHYRGINGIPDNWEIRYIDVSNN